MKTHYLGAIVVLAIGYFIGAKWPGGLSKLGM